MVKRWLLKKLREDANLSIQEMADLIGITKCVIWRIEELPTQNPTIKTLMKIADFFEVEISEIVISPEEFHKNLNSY